MTWLLGGYMWLYVHRPFEWKGMKWLGDLQFERGYILLMLVAWLVNPNKGFTMSRMHIGLGLFLTALLGGWMNSPFANKPGCWETVDTSLKVLVFYGILTTTVRDEKNLRLLMLMFLAVTGIYMLHSYYEFLCGRYQHRMGVNRMMGVDITFADPNAFASTLLYTLPMLVPFWMEQPRRIPRWLLIGYAALVAFCILRTGSRAGFLALIGLTVMLIVANSRHKFRALTLCAVIGGMVGFIVLVAMPDDLQRRYLTLLDSSVGPENAQVSAEGRWHGLVEGIRLWTKSPVFGYGPASFPHATGEGFQAHNLYGQVLSELGSVGALALGVMVLCFFLNWRLAHFYRHSDADFAYQVVRAIGFQVILLLMMGFAGHNLFRYNWQWFAAFQVIAIHVLCQRASDPAYGLPRWSPSYAGVYA